MLYYVAMDPTHVSHAHRPLPTPFLRKTYQLVDDPAVNDTISWNEDGSTFVVWRPAEFARDLLPKFFKHNNFSSFVRQLNTYGFRKKAPDRWEFANDGFRRGEKRLLLEIHRRKVPSATAANNSKVVDGAAAVPISFTANAIPAAYTMPDHHLRPREVGQSRWYLDGSSRDRDLLNENKRLKKENTNLNNELTQVKCMCKNIMSVMSTYSAETSRAVGVEKAPLDVAPTLQQPVLEVPSSGSGCGEETMEGEDTVPRSPAMLFGVPIGKEVPRRDISDNRVEVMALDKHDLSAAAAAAAGESGRDEGNKQITYFYEEYDKCWVYS